MKKGLLLFAASAMLLLNSEKVAAQAFDEGNLSIDIYTGFPNLLNNFISDNIDILDFDDEVEFSTIPTIGGRLSYFVADRISVGIDVNYSSFSADYVENFTEYNYNLTLNRLRLMGRFEIHFGQNDNFDFYIPIAAGLHRLSLSGETDDPDINNQYDSDIEDLNTALNLFGGSIAARVGLGGRFFFTDNIGLNMEFGLGGGPLVQAGLAFRF